MTGPAATSRAEVLFACAWADCPPILANPPPLEREQDRLPGPGDARTHPVPRGMPRTGGVVEARGPPGPHPARTPAVVGGVGRLRKDRPAGASRAPERG